MSARPQDLVFTLFGEYLLDREDPVWVGSLIALLQPLGLKEGAVRTVLSRMTRKGWLHSERMGRHSYYDLTDRGRRLLEQGRARILHPTWNRQWDERWFLLAYSIPEDVRHLRDRLRDRLAWLGFGSLGNGLWISPHDVAKEVAEVADQLGIAHHVEYFRSERVGGGPPEALVARCWDIAAVNGHYRVFIERWQPTLDGLAARLQSGGGPSAESYTLRFALIHEFRSFPLEDPYLPRALLPADWAGEEATRLFHGLHDRLVGAADEYVDLVLGAAPVRTPAGTP